MARQIDQTIFNMFIRGKQTIFPDSHYFGIESDEGMLVIITYPIYQGVFQASFYIFSLVCDIICRGGQN